MGLNKDLPENPRGGPRMAAPLLFLGMILCGAPAVPTTSPADAPQPGPRGTEVRMSDYQAVRYVSARTGSDTDGDGTKKKPWASLAHALLRVPAAGPTRRSAILVADGVYRGATLLMKPGVDLYGGFEPERWTRDIFAHTTTLDGEEKRRVVEGADDARIDGFNIVRGRVRGNGGGLLCLKTSPLITNNVFFDNRALGPTAWNPKNLHELANDGGAIACIDGAAPRIEHNLFAANSTEIGRGGAVACHLNSPAQIVGNVFVENQSGLTDPKRSSDGGAISLFERSHAEVRQNIIVRNRSLTQNDSGGIFVALWSAPLIEGNTIVGNEGGDDGGGLFVGGQEHRYDRPLDPLPPADSYRVRILRNLFIGNEHQGGGAKAPVSGAMRITMQSRALLENNIIAENPGGVYLQRSELVLRNNTILDDLRHVEEPEGLATAILVNNIFRGKLAIETRASLTYCNTTGGYAGVGNFETDPMFIADELRGSMDIVRSNIRDFTTTIKTTGGLRAHGLAGRAIQLGKAWSVVKDNDEVSITVWGFPTKGTAAGAKPEYRIPPTYRLRPGSRCIDRGTNENAPAADFDGIPRPLNGGISRTSDIGAREYNAMAGKK